MLYHNYIRGKVELFTEEERKISLFSYAECFTGVFPREKMQLMYSVSGNLHCGLLSSRVNST